MKKALFFIVLFSGQNLDIKFQIGENYEKKDILIFNGTISYGMYK